VNYRLTSFDIGVVFLKIEIQGKAMWKGATSNIANLLKILPAASVDKVNLSPVAYRGGVFKSPFPEILKF
jgi:hypothetical protein